MRPSLIAIKQWMILHLACLFSEMWLIDVPNGTLTQYTYLKIEWNANTERNELCVMATLIRLLSKDYSMWEVKQCSTD